MMHDWEEISKTRVSFFIRVSKMTRKQKKHSAVSFLVLGNPNWNTRIRFCGHLPQRGISTNAIVCVSKSVRNPFCVSKSVLTLFDSRSCRPNPPNRVRCDSFQSQSECVRRHVRVGAFEQLFSLGRPEGGIWTKIFQKFKYPGGHPGGCGSFDLTGT